MEELKMKNKTRRIVAGGLIAAIYAAVTLALSGISYGVAQFRVSEVLTVLPFFMPEAIPGLTVGCFVANLIGSASNLASATAWIDIILGPIATLLAATVTYLIGKRFKHEFSLKKAWYAPMPAVISNAIIIGGELTYMFMGTIDEAPFYIIATLVGLGELASCYLLGIPFMIYFNKVKSKII